jgi:Zn-dependent protease with chaperone function/Zn-finger nucleic acid-binding protein
MNGIDRERLRRNFWDEQEHNRKRIPFLLLPLIAVYLLLFVGLILISAIFAPQLLILFLQPTAWPWIAGVSLIVATGHFIYARSVALTRIRDFLKAEPPDPMDRYHRRLVNVVEEMCLAGGLSIPEIRVLPSFALNALALADRRPATLYVTEGIVSTFTRDELQAVVAHALCHVETGDARTGTLVVALAYAIGYLLSSEKHIDEQKELLKDDPHALGFAIMTAILSFFISILISALSSVVGRSRKDLADAFAVQLTRNPDALASALLRMDRARGVGLGLDANVWGILCVAPPAYSPIDRRSGMMADLFALHPPLEARIHKISGKIPAHFERAERKRRADASPRQPEERYNVFRDNVWLGPFRLHELTALAWITPETWICPEGEEKVNLATTAPWFLNRRNGGSQEGVATAGVCPSCSGGLVEEYYEGVPIRRCSNCAAALLDRRGLQKIILREENQISADAGDAHVRLVAEIAQTKRPGSEIIAEASEREGERACPDCGRAMEKRFYSLARPVVMDECPVCATIHLDHGELEAVQAAG